MREPYGRHKYKWGQRSGKWQAAEYLHEKKKTILTIRTGPVGGATHVCRVHVYFPASALISISAAVQAEVKQVEVKEGNGRASIKVSQAQSRDPL